MTPTQCGFLESLTEETEREDPDIRRFFPFFGITSTWDFEFQGVRETCASFCLVSIAVQHIGAFFIAF
jgi:hypothetical protein